MGRKLVGVPHRETRTDTTRQPAGEPERGGDRTAATDATELTPMASTATGTSGATTERVSDWVDKIKDTIPVEVVTAWIAIHSLLTVGTEGPITGYWSVFGVVLVATGLYMWVDIEVPDSEEATWKELSRWEKRIAVGAHVGLAMGAFVVWALYLLAAGETAVEPPLLLPAFELPETRHATILLVLYTLVGPQLVPQLVSKLLGVRLETPEETTDATEEGTSG